MFPKLWKVLQAHGSCFDDKWAYRKTAKYVLRFPVWARPQSGSYWEDKDQRRPRKQEHTLSNFLDNP